MLDNSVNLTRKVHVLYYRNECCCNVVAYEAHVARSEETRLCLLGSVFATP